MAIKDKIAGSEIVQNIVKGALKHIQIDDSKEYMSLYRVRNAITTDISVSKSPYLEIFKTEGLPTDQLCLDLNRAGYELDDLRFHQHYFATSSLSNILDGKVSSVVQNNSLINEDFINRDELKDTQIALDTYGRCSIMIEELEPTYNESEITVIRPYRYYVKNEQSILFTFLGTSDEGETIYERRMFEVSEQGNVTQTKEVRVITKKGLETVSSETRNVDYMPMYEIKKNNTGIDKIRFHLSMIDVTETVMSLETVNSQFSIHADEKYFENGQVIKSDFYRLYQSGLGGETPLFNPFQPELRQADYEGIKDAYKQSIAQNLGVSRRLLGLSISFDTATALLLDEEDSTKTINDNKEDLQRLFNEFLSLYFENQILTLPPYVSDSLAFRSRVVSEIGDNASVERKVKLLNPTLDEDGLTRETILVKQEQGILLTSEEEKFARKKNMFPEIDGSFEESGS